MRLTLCAFVIMLWIQEERDLSPMKCPSCLSDNPDDTRYCGKCGSSLLRQKKESDSLTKTIQASAKEILPGEAFGKRYKIIQELGRGGMGVVYKAEDTRLKRTVALKSLSPLALTGQQERIRFIREAQAAAALNHPNICTIYEIDEAEGRSYIAMEYIEGQTLKEKNQLAPLHIEEVIEIGIQVAEGLKQAHEKGVVHRDIKSSNIMITDKGLAKITDFGLAKSTGSSIITREGTTLGTVSYMSPEQARGEHVDLRSDIWSFGVVLFEAITGQLPFYGDLDQVVLYSIIHENPRPLTDLRSGIPLEFERIVTKCLEKDRSFRYQSTSDILTDLKRLKRDLESKRTHTLRSATRIKSRRKRTPFRIGWISWGGILILLLAAIYLTFLRPTGSSLPALTELKLTPFTSGSGLSVFPSWSPDGEWIVYASDEAGSLDIWKRPLRGGEAVQLTTSPHNESQPDWSPDGRTIAFSSDQEGGGIFLIPSEGGTPYPLTSFGANPGWSPDSETLTFDWNGNIYLVSFKGGEPRIEVSGTSATPHTVWTSDGEKLIYWNRTNGDIFVHSIKNGNTKPLGLIPSGEEVSGLALSKDGRMLFVSRGPFGANKNLWRVRINLEKDEAVGDFRSLSFTTTEDIQCSLSPDGSKMAFTVFQSERHLWSYPVDPATGMIQEEKKPVRLTYKSKNNYYPSFARDGRKLVWTSHLTSQGVICIRDLEEGEERKVTREWGENAREVGASFSPDGKQICFSTTLSGSYAVWRMPSLGSIGIPLTKTTKPDKDTITAWSPDGRTIAFYSNRTGSWDIWSIRLEDESKPQPLTQWETNEMYPAWSPDGQHIAFTTDKEGNADIWIMEADGSNPMAYVKHPAEEGWSAWSTDGRQFYFTSNRNGAFNVWMMDTVDGEPRQLTDFRGLSHGLPEVALFTKFAVSSSSLILPMEDRTGDIYILENLK